MADRQNDTRQADEPMYAAQSGRGGYQRQGIAETALKAFIRSIASSLGRVIMRAITGRR